MSIRSDRFDRLILVASSVGLGEVIGDGLLHFTSASPTGAWWTLIIFVTLPSQDFHFLSRSPTGHELLFWGLSREFPPQRLPGPKRLPSAPFTLRGMVQGVQTCASASCPPPRRTAGGLSCG